MSTYYIYKVAPATKNDDIKVRPTVNLVYVTDVMDFTLDVFNPVTMEFCGVAVEADSLDQAILSFNKPTADSKIFAIEEPLPTRIRRESFNKEYLSSINNADADAEKELNQLVINKLSLLINNSLDLLNKQLSEMAYRIRKHTNAHQDVTVEKLYERLKYNATESLERDAKYTRPSDDL